MVTSNIELLEQRKRERNSSGEHVGDVQKGAEASSRSVCPADTSVSMRTWPIPALGKPGHLLMSCMLDATLKL
jgi:hypothetical protein